MFNSLQSLGIDIDVETNSIDISEKFAQFFSFSDVIDDEVLTSFFGSKINSSDVSVVELNWIDVDLKDLFVDFFKSLQKFVFKLFFSLLSAFLFQT